MKKLYSILTVLFFSAAVHAQTNHGYVVKINSDTVYLDITDIEPAPEEGSAFNVFVEDEPLYNPITKKQLGSLLVEKGSGIITQVHPAYAIGTMNEVKTELAVGDRVKFLPKETIKETAEQGKESRLKEEQPAQEEGIFAKTQALFKSEKLDYVVSGITLADIDGDGTNEIITVDEDHVIRALKIENGEIEETAFVKFPKTLRPLWLESAVVDGKTKIFAIVNDTASNNINTRIYTAQNNEFTEEGSVRFMLTAAIAADGSKKFYGIEKYQSKNLELSPVKHVEFKDGKPVMGSMDKWPRFKWIFGFTFAELDGERALIHSVNGNKISTQFEKRGHHTSVGDDFTRTPLRINQNSRIMYFYPRVLVANHDGGTYAYAAVNKAKLGILSYTFGSFQTGFIRRLTWKDGSFSYTPETDDLKTPGYIINFIIGDAANYKNVLVVPAVGGDDKTTIALYNL